MQQQPVQEPIPASRPGLVPMLVLLLVWAAMLLAGGGDIDQAAVAGSHVSGGWRTPVLIVTRFGDWEILVGLTSLAAGWLIYRRQMPRALLLIGSTLIARLLVEIQKAILARARPEQDEPFIVEESFAYPSGHAANSMIVYLLLAILLTRDPGQRRIAVIAAMLASLLIGSSRVLLGVHWPSDVIGGWSFGLFWGLLTLRLWRARAA